MDKQPVGLILIYQKNVGSVEKVTEEIKPYLAGIVKNLSDEGFITKKEDFDKILDGEFVYFARVDDGDFQQIKQDKTSLGAMAMDVYKMNTEVEPNEDVDVISYDGKKAPWKFNLFVAVVYAI